MTMDQQSGVNLSSSQRNFWCFRAETSPRRDK